MKLNKYVKNAIVTLAIILAIVAFGLFRLHRLNTTPLEAENFSWINKVEIYALGLIMPAIAFPFYPEVAREQLMMYRPFGETIEVIEDDFFLKSDVVRAAIKKSQQLNRPYRLVWPATAYALTLGGKKYWEARISLALNGALIRVEDGHAIVRVKIAYPKKSFAPLIVIPGILTIGVEEGLFWILEKEGWLNAGYMEWKAKLPS